MSPCKDNLKAHIKNASSILAIAASPISRLATAASPSFMLATVVLNLKHTAE